MFAAVKERFGRVDVLVANATERVLGAAAARKRECCCERRIHESGLPGRKTLDRQQDLVITGKPGTGKSHILMSIALRACEAGHLRAAECVFRPS